MTRREGDGAAPSKRPKTTVVYPHSSESAEDYNRLLAHFDTDQRRAEEQFLEFRRRLIVSFDRRQCQDPELQADEALSRAARSKDLQSVKDIRGFVYEVARRLALERGRIQQREPRQVDDLERVTPAEAMTDTLRDPQDSKVHEIKLRCLDSCLNRLQKRDRTLLLDYYREEKAQKLKLRKLLADRLGIRIATLRTRLTRARVQLAACCEDCIQKSLAQMKQF